MRIDEHLTAYFFTVKCFSLLTDPQGAETVTGPDSADSGTTTHILLFFQFTILASTPGLKVTFPASSPNLRPRIRTWSPGSPAFGKKVFMYG
jgi:hypothetical protein